LIREVATTDFTHGQESCQAIWMKRAIFSSSDSLVHALKLVGP